MSLTRPLTRSLTRPLTRPLVGHKYAPRNTYDADALDYITRAEALDATAFDLSADNATATTSYTKAGHNELVRVLKGNATTLFTGVSSIGGDSFGTQPTPTNVWSLLTELYALEGVRFGALMAKLKYASGGTSTLTNNNFVTGDYLPVGAGAGLKGDGSTKYLDTGLLDSSLSADDKSFGRYCTSADTAGGRTLANRDDGSGNDIWGILEAASNRVDVWIPFDDAKPALSPVDPVSFILGSRRGINDVEAYLNGASASVDTTTATASNSTLSWPLFAQMGSGGAGNFSNARLTFAHIGTGLTDAQAAYLSWCVNAWATYLGSNTYVNS